MDSVEECLVFFKKSYPQHTPKNFRTQLGVFLEEVAETLRALDCSSPDDNLTISYLGVAIHNVGEHLKKTDNVIGLKDRVEFLDGLCDVMVTAIGLANHSNMNIAGAFNEVNASNMSKFDENGEPILDSNLKVVKGPNYRKPELKAYI